MKFHACAAAAMATLLFCAPAIPSAHAETTLCTEITALPFTITTQGVYCLKQNLNVNLAAGNAITVNAGNVIIEFNDFRINNQAPLATNQANGVYALDRKNITLRNGFIRGFYRGVFFDENVANASSSHLVEGMKIADSGNYGIRVEGDQSVIRDNRVLTTGGGTFTVATGIYLANADGGIVSGNIIDGMTETVQNYGVFINGSIRVKVTGNEISGVDGGTDDRAIRLQGADIVIVAQNRLLNDPGTGTGAIVETSGFDNVVCYDNEAAGFGATPFADCDVSDGNRVGFD